MSRVASEDSPPSSPIHVHHTLTTVNAKLCPPTWEEENNLVCAVLIQIVDEGNLRYLANEDNSSKIWGDLTQAHQDSSTGGQVFWIRKLVNAQMEGNDINTHIKALAKFHERLNSLVTPENPLTPDNVHNAGLLSSIPPDWIHCVSNLMNQEGVKTNTIVKALCNKAIQQESQGDIISVFSTKPKLVNPNPPLTKPKVQEPEAPKKPRQCLLCNSNTHDLNSCNNTRNLIMEHKAAQKTRWEASQQNIPSTLSKAPALVNPAVPPSPPSSDLVPLGSNPIPPITPSVKESEPAPPPPSPSSDGDLTFISLPDLPPLPPSPTPSPPPQQASTCQSKPPNRLGH
ncbi:hypothetical protein PCASD_07671 [Puccinia coronata f. sp. avenae]|uniref:Uncharacterized protein n=1 Tax=Puccinia coronata f. sp. avenae TaxID=200324 RepID=A0A2N5UP53_9BASI|nr:hypothetical protein PCASD_07671 [Puccinia coronata f. sp. avenae]